MCCMATVRELIVVSMTHVHDQHAILHIYALR
jgi:hypothetical protein